MAFRKGCKAYRFSVHYEYDRGKGREGTRGGAGWTRDGGVWPEKRGVLARGACGRGLWLAVSGGGVIERESAAGSGLDGLASTTGARAGQWPAAAQDGLVRRRRRGGWGRCGRG